MRAVRRRRVGHDPRRADRSAALSEVLGPVTERLWEVRGQSTNGLAVIRGSEGHCRLVHGRWRTLMEHPMRYGVGYVGVWLVDPDGEVHDAHGYGVGEPSVFQTLRHLVWGEWRDCRGCGRLVAEGQLLSDTDRCSRCTYADDPVPRPSVFRERVETVPRPTKCVRCGSGTKKDRRYVPGAGWHCSDCASTRDARESARRAERA